VAELREYSGEDGLGEIRKQQGDRELAQLAGAVGKDWAGAEYYDRAEEDDWLATFWSDESPFLRLFKELDLTCVLELACGHGRHAEKLREQAQTVILVDINVGNIEFCRTRFKEFSQFRYVLTNGYSLDTVQERECSAILSYDAMVHFDSDVVRAYLQEMARVLKPGGRALIHHSNYSANPGGDVHNNPCWRNFMTEQLFHHYAARSGLRRLASKLMDWEGHPALDCLTLLERPADRR
jgi:SAM-dependent methyltransferase